MAAARVDREATSPGRGGKRLIWVAIRNARIVTVSGAEIENGTVVIRDGKIEAVGASATVPAGAQEIDARGLIVYPGMIDLGTSMGLVEIGSGAPGGVDTSELGDMNPNIQAIVAVNPHSAHVNITRVNGVTSVLTSPTGGIIWFSNRPWNDWVSTVELPDSRNAYSPTRYCKRCSQTRPLNCSSSLSCVSSSSVTRAIRDRQVWSRALGGASRP